MMIFNAKVIGSAAKALAVSVILLVTSAPAIAGDPVPGIDISLEQIPGGKTITIKTFGAGNFVFDRLPPGTYMLRLGPLSPAKVENHNSSRSNKTYPLAPSADGSWTYTVDIEVSSKVVPGKDPGTTITVGKPGPGRISGQVTTVDIKDEIMQLVKGPNAVNVKLTSAQVNAISDSVDDYVASAENHSSSRKNVKLTMKNAGVSDETIEEVLSMVEERAQRTGQGEVWNQSATLGSDKGGVDASQKINCSDCGSQCKGRCVRSGNSCFCYGTLSK